MSVFTDFARPLTPPERQIVGRNMEMQQIFASLCRPTLCNVILLAPAGAGKTATVQGLSVMDKGNDYYEVDLAAMRAAYDDAGFAKAIGDLCNEASAMNKTRRADDQKRGVVLFIDEFHILTQLSDAAAEAIKPVLAASGARGLKLIGATTYEEFEQYIKPNAALLQRLHRINILPPTDKVTIDILRGYAATYNVLDQIPSYLLPRIVEITNRYMPANSQPRKALLVLDSMMGYYIMSCIGGNPVAFDRRLLQKVMWESEGVKISTRVDPLTIKSRLDAKVFAQDFATSAIETRMQAAVADLNRHDRPMATLLFTGSTGTGKTQTAKELANIMFDDPNAFIRFDMTEFSESNSIDRFRTELCTKVWERPNSVILLDEIEKAHKTVIRLLLPVLDDGRLTDEFNRVVSFLNSYIIMTTNAGTDLYEILSQYDSSDTGSKEHMAGYMKMIKRHLITGTEDVKFPPELMGRIDTIVPFSPLSEATQYKIVDNRLAEIASEVKSKYNIEVRYTSKVRTYVVEDQNSTESNEGGARVLLATIDADVIAAISRHINLNHGAKVIEVDVGGNMAAGDKTRPESSAYITVKTIEE